MRTGSPKAERFDSGAYPGTYTLRMALPRSSEALDAHLVALGVPVRVRCLGARADELHESVRTAWHDCLELPTDPAMGLVTIDCRLGDGEATCAEPTLVSGSSLPLVMDRLSPVITERAIRAQAGRLLML